MTENKKHELPRVNERLLKRYSYTPSEDIYGAFLSTVKQVYGDKYVGAVMLYAMGESVADIKLRQSIAESRLKNWFCRAVDLYYADRLTYTTSDTCSSSVVEELKQDNIDLDKVINQMLGKPIVRKSADELLKDFLNIVREAGYERIAQEIEDSYKEDSNNKTMRLGAYESTRYLFISQPVSEKPTLFIREFDKKIGKTITSDGVMREYTF